MNSSNSSKKRGPDALKMSVTMTMQSYVISVKHGFALIVNIFIILITNIYKDVTIHGIAFSVPQ